MTKNVARQPNSVPNMLPSGMPTTEASDQPMKDKGDGLRSPFRRHQQTDRRRRLRREQRRRNHGHGADDKQRPEFRRKCCQAMANRVNRRRHRQQHAPVKPAGQPRQHRSTDPHNQTAGKQQQPRRGRRHLEIGPQHIQKPGREQNPRANDKIAKQQGPKRQALGSLAGTGCHGACLHKAKRKQPAAKPVQRPLSMGLCIYAAPAK